MDALIDAAARALATGDPIGALNRVALRADAPALALRGIAMAQLGDLDRARVLVRDAARAFGSRDAMARARCTVAEAEIALASRDLGFSENELESARDVLVRHGDSFNAAYARHLNIRRQVLLGRLDDAAAALTATRAESSAWPPALRAVHALVEAGIALHRLHAAAAREASIRATSAARESRIDALIAEAERAAMQLDAPAARTIGRDGSTLLRLDDVESLLASDALVVDACRYGVHRRDVHVPLSRRPVLFALARALAEAWPGDATRERLIEHAFRIRRADETHRARLRVEIGRLRALLEGLATIDATQAGFRIAPVGDRPLVLLARPVDEAHAALLALLADGVAWSSSNLAIALDSSQRSVQRALDVLAGAGRIQSAGRGRARKWLMPPMPSFATALLLTPHAPRPSA